MMEMRNYSPFPNLRFYNSDNKGQEFGVVLLKGTYAIRNDTLVIADEQAPILFEDTYHGALNTSSLWLPTDLVGKKPRTDIILNAKARSPGGRPSKHWTCGIAIEGGVHPFAHRLAVCGPRQWQPTWHLPEVLLDKISDDVRANTFKGWILREPEEAAEIAICYEHSYGGVVARSRNGQAPSNEPYHYNPIGCGWIDATDTPRDTPIDAPQITALDAPPLQPMQHARPAGFGPIPPAWLPRRPLGGTFDDHWKTNIWPNWPKDYNFAYNNSANPDMVYPGYLVGHETIVLDGLDVERASRQIRLPDHRMTAVFDQDRDTLREMDLDTLILDIADPDPLEHRAFLSWRTTFELATSDITLVLHRGAMARGEITALGEASELAP